MKHKILSILVLLGFSAIGLSNYQATAATPQPSKISLRPFLEELKINPGEATKSFQLSVSNDSDFKQVFHLAAVNFGSLSETGGLVFEGASSNRLSGQYGLARWLSLDRNDIELDAGQQTVVNVTINNDSNLAPGAHYAAVIVTASKTISAVGQLTITPKVSSLIFITKLGGEKYDIHLESATLNGSLWHPATQVSLRLKSTGNTYIIPRGVVSLKQGTKVIARGVINDESSIVLPATIRNFDVPLSGISKLKSGLFFTKYNIQIDYRYDGNPNFATHSYNEMFINKTGIFSLMLAVLVIGILLVYGPKRHIRLWPWVTKKPR